MKKNYYNKLTFRKVLLNLMVILYAPFVWGQGYIYLHKDATSENSSPNFNFSVTGGPTGTFTQNFTLNDQHVVNTIVDLGATSNGGLWATAGAGLPDQPIYYRAPGASVWTVITDAAGRHIDGGGVDVAGRPKHIHTNNAGNAFYYDGQSFFNTAATNAGDVAIDKNTDRVFYVKAGGADEGLTPFSCSNLAYQISGPNTENSSLYSYNVATGARTLMGTLPARVNSIGYNTLDNYIWGINVLTNQVVKIGSNAVLATYTVPNLPAPTVSAYYNVGEVFGDGYLFVYSRLEARYYVIDINPARTATYLQLVDPTASYVLDAAPYGNTFTGAAASLDISDIVYNSSNGLLYGIIDAQSATNAYRRFTINPVTRQVTIAAVTVAGGGIQDNEGVAFGSVFIDQTANTFYVFANTLGGFYRINMTTNTATLISTAPTGGANNNDGASCPNTLLVAPISGNVFHDPDGENVNNSTGSPNTIPSGLYANLIGANGNVVAVSVVNSSGFYGFNDIVAGDYTVVLSTTNGTVGDAAPSPNLPAGWINTGEFNGAENMGNTGPVDGISPQFTVGLNSTNINFGIQQPPVADIKSFTLSTTPAANSIIELGLGGDVNSGTVPANLTGNDPDGGILNSTSTDPYDVTINTLSTHGTLLYDGLPITTPDFLISDYDPAKLDFQFTGSGYSNTSFTYSVHDAAGSVSAPASYAIGWAGPITGTLISGNIFNDGNGASDATVNTSGDSPLNPVDGTNLNGADGPLYVSLLNNGGNVIQTVPVSLTGIYTFLNVVSGVYSTVLTTNSGGSNTPSLPAGWGNTGEQVGLIGIQSPTDGVITGITVNTTDPVTNINFGINKKPVVTAETADTKPNPGGTILSPVTFPTGEGYSGNDVEDNYVVLLVGKTVTLYPATGGTLYYDADGDGVADPGEQITVATLISNFVPGKVYVDPTVDGSTNVTFDYAVTDVAGITADAQTVTIPFAAGLIISGNIFDDGNGASDTTVNTSGDSPLNPVDGTNLNGADGPLYVSLLNNGGNVIQTVPVSLTGIYTFLNVVSGVYSTVLTTNSGGSNTPSLPAGWGNTGEQIGLIGIQSPTDGVITGITVNTTDPVTNVNFGINKKPVVTAETADTKPNPGGTILSPVTFPTGEGYSGNDVEDNYIVLLAGKTVTLYPATGGTLYYDADGDGVADPGEQITVATLISNFVPGKVYVDPTVDGSTNVTFDYAVTDVAGITADAQTVTIPFAAGLIISGNVFDDGNGASDATVNTSGDSPLNPVDGTNLNGADGPLYVSLLNNGGNVIQTVPVSLTGIYTFLNVTSGVYSTVLTTNSGGSNTPSLPAGWGNTGEQIGLIGIQSPTDGVITGITVNTTDPITNVNFGINKKPVVTAETADTKPNPGGTILSPVTFPSGEGYSGNDVEDNYVVLLAGETVTLYPATGGTLYYDADGDGVADPGEQITVATLISNFVPGKVYVDPTEASASTVVTFDYVITDAAGVISEPQTLTIPFESALPVTLTSFTVKKGEGNVVNLAWATTEETNSEKFEIEHSADGKNWTLIASIASKGESKELSKYSYVDTTPFNGENLYRLKMVDFDGTYAFSSIRAVSVENASTRISTYPNPVQDELIIEGLSGSETIKVVDISGRVIVESRNKAGENKKTLNIGSLSNGIYVINIQTLDGSSVSRKVIKIK